jgi:hypothetical protein
VHRHPRPVALGARRSEDLGVKDHAPTLNAPLAGGERFGELEILRR